MKSYLLPGLFLGFVFCVNLKAEISIDGVLDEREWEAARKIDTFYEVFPYSLKEISDFKTDILIFENWITYAKTIGDESYKKIL